MLFPPVWQPVAAIDPGQLPSMREHKTGLDAELFAVPCNCVRKMAPAAGALCEIRPNVLREIRILQNLNRYAPLARRREDGAGAQ